MPRPKSLTAAGGAAWLAAAIACAAARPAAADQMPANQEPSTQTLAKDTSPSSACDARCVLVDVATAREGSFSASVVLTGTIAPKYQSNIAFRTGGKIVQRLVEVGAHVGPDEVLARLDPRDQNANFDTARAGLASAQALLVQAEVNFGRQKALYADGYATRPSFDLAQQQLRTQQAAVESAKAALGTAQEQLGYADLKAGVAGIVVGRSAEVGQVVQAGQTVFVLAQDGPRDAVFDVYEALLTEPPASKTVQVALQSDFAVRTTGTVRETSPTVDDKSGAVKVKVGLDRVPAGMSLGAAVIGSGAFKPQRAIVLPRGALFRWNDRPAVWLYDGATGTVAPRIVEVMVFDGGNLVLSAGLAPGDTAVTAGTQFLHPGQRVAIAKREDAVASDPASRADALLRAEFPR